MNLSRQEIDLYLRQQDNQYATEVLPVILFLAMLMITGVLGNSLVCYVYLVKLKQGTTRYFILALAVYDLVNCCVCIPGEIADMSHNYTFGGNGLCKIMRLLLSFTSYSSVTVLLLVAFDRYRKICQPFHKQTSPRFARIAITVCSLSAFVVSLPNVALYGSRTISTSDGHVNGSDCTTADEYIRTPYPLIFNGVEFIVFIISTISLTVLYFLIWKRIARQHEFRRSAGSRQINDVIHLSMRDPNNFNICPSHAMSVLEKGAKKTISMLLLITLVFVLSFLPHLCVMVARAVNSNLYDGIHGAGLIAYNLFVRSYFFNSACNPIIYGFCNGQFRLELRQIWRKLMCRA
ncbi:orexin/Hypocretin receptor type 1-like [Haliotis rubra]|uniref:orexin/Hypocretin receptor type 1-like n=1 Tax=Haliotis rubra TaxID=36100 RepID=UPI001EE5AF99|nr:orexin/Hypocretin receptor type 1-like [Haliotis rubra]